MKYTHGDWPTKFDRYDRFQTFYTSNGPLVFFQDGSIGLDVGLRRGEDTRYIHPGVILVRTTMTGLGDFYLDEGRTEKVPAAWLSHAGPQHLLVDRHHGVAVAASANGGQHLGRYQVENSRGENAKPDQGVFALFHLTTFAVVWTGWNEWPQSRLGTTISRPDPATAPLNRGNQAEKLNNVAKVMYSAARLTHPDMPKDAWDRPDYHRYEDIRRRRVDMKAAWVDMDVSEIVADISGVIPNGYWPEFHRPRDVFQVPRIFCRKDTLNI